MILAGDFGGTKCNLALFKSERGRLAIIARKTYLCREFSKPDLVIADFLAQHRPRKIVYACFAAAGPVFNGAVEFVHLQWRMSRKALECRFRIKSVVLVNDLVATLYGIDLLGPSDFCTLQRGGAVKEGPRAIIGIGTGMNEMIAFWDAQRREYTPIPSESGHADFAPRNKTEIELFQALRNKHKKSVSWEMVLTGGGLVRIHEFLDPSTDHAKLAKEKCKPEELISENARTKKCKVCVRTLNLWASMYGAEAGNIALRSLTTGGIFLAGGTTLAGLYNLGKTQFLAAFTKKARLGTILRGIPVKIILNNDVPPSWCCLHSQQQTDGLCLMLLEK